MTLDNMDEDTKRILFHAVISFCDNFYYDDLTGETLFTKNILQNKGQSSYSMLLTHELSKADVVPVLLENQADEAKATQEWLNMAKTENEKQGYHYW